MEAAISRDGSGVYSKPSGTTAVSGTTVSSSAYNTFCDDLVADANAARPITAGGTGATSASAARTALGVSATDATITAIAALDFSVAGSMLYSTAADTFSLLTSTVAGRALLTAADASAQRTALGLGTAAVKATGTSGNTVPLLDAANTWSADQTISSTGPNFYLQETDASTNNKLWRILAQGEDLYFGAVNDAINSAGYWAIVSRTGVTIDAIALAATALTFNAVAIPTISSSDTLSNKTLSSPTLSGTVAGAAAWSGAQTWNALGVFVAAAEATNGARITNSATSRRLHLYSGKVGSQNGDLDLDAEDGNNVVIKTSGASRASFNSTQATYSVPIQAPVAISSETSGTLTSASSNKQVNASGDITINDGVHAAGDRIEIYAGASARSIIQDTGMTLRLDGSATTGTRSLAARGRAAIYFVSNSEAIVSGMGVS